MGTPNGYPEINTLLFRFPHPVREEAADPHRAETHSSRQGQIQTLVWITFLDFVMFVLFASLKIFVTFFLFQINTLLHT